MFVSEAALTGMLSSKTVKWHICVIYEWKYSSKAPVHQTADNVATSLADCFQALDQRSSLWQVNANTFEDLFSFIFCILLKKFNLKLSSTTLKSALLLPHLMILVHFAQSENKYEIIDSLLLPWFNL